MLEALDALAGHLDDVRRSAATGAREPVQQFLAAVQEQISLEHRQWQETAESTQSSLTKLEETLAAARIKFNEVPGLN